MLRNLLTQKAQILRWMTDSEDQYGSEVSEFVDESERLWPCKLDNTGSTEVETERNTRTSMYTLWLPDDAANQISALDRVVINGVTYEVVGEPLIHYRRARVSHVEATVRFIEG